MNPADMASALEAVPQTEQPGRVPTGSYGLDLLLGGGWPRNCASEIHGPPMSGKSTLVYETAAGVSQQETVLLVDLDGSFSTRYGLDIGINSSNLIVVRNPELASGYFRAGLPAGLAIFDGIPTPDEARVVGRILADVPCTALCTTQEREHLVMRGNTWVGVGVAAGWISEPSLRIRLCPDIEGYTTASVKTDSANLPGRGPAFFKIGDSGIDTAEELLSLGLIFGVITRAPGARFWMDKVYLGHGTDAARSAIAAGQGLAETIWGEVVALSGTVW